MVTLKVDSKDRIWGELADEKSLKQWQNVGMLKCKTKT